MYRLVGLLFVLASLSARADVTDLLKGEPDIHQETLNGDVYLVLTALGSSCYVLNTARIASIPQTKIDLIAQMQATSRDLTPDEQALCTHNPVWVVAATPTSCDPAAAGNYCTQPLREIDSAGGGLQPNTVGLVPDYAPCGSQVGADQTIRAVDYGGLHGYATCEIVPVALPVATAPALTASGQIFSNTVPYPGQPIGRAPGAPCAAPSYVYGAKTYYTVKFTDIYGSSRTGVAVCQ